MGDINTSEDENVYKLDIGVMDARIVEAYCGSSDGSWSKYSFTPFTMPKGDDQVALPFNMLVHKEDTHLHLVDENGRSFYYDIQYDADKDACNALVVENDSEISCEIWYQNAPANCNYYSQR